MATIVLTTVGTLVGGPIGGAIGAVIGQSMDAVLFAPKARHGPRLGDLSVQTSSYGTAIPKLFGTMRVAGTVIWSTDLIERSATSGGGKGRPSQVSYSYSASFAVALSARRIVAVRRIWADGKLLRGASGDFKAKTGFRLHLGGEDQAVDPLIAAAEGAANAPAFRGIAYAVFEELELADFGNRIPSLSFELVADDGPVAIGAIAEALAGGTIGNGGTSSIDGFAASGDGVRGAIEDLAELAGLSLRDDGAVMRLEEAAGEPVPLAATIVSGRPETVRGAAAAIPGEVSVAYYDVGRDYQTGLQRASSGASPSARTERRALAAALGAGAAKAMAERRLDTLWTQRVGASVTCSWAAAAIRPGMRVRIGEESGVWRVSRATIGPMTMKLDLVRSGETGAGETGASPGRPVSQVDLPHGPTILRLLDLPLGGAADRPGLNLVAAGIEPGWRRAELSATFDGGASWTDIGATPAPAVLGQAVTVLPPGSASLFDAEASIEVELLHGNMILIGRDDDALVGGANLALIGAELVQFGHVEAAGPLRYRLSRLLRGRRGTEWAAETHAAGEPFTLIESQSLE